MKKTIWGNTLVKNEDLYIWFAVESVIGYLDKLLIWDTGSSDKTVDIIKELEKKYPDKIIFQQYGEVDRQTFTKARQEMLETTDGDWVFILDGDEVWWEASIKKVREVIEEKGDSLDLLVNPTINPIGDIYHYQESRAGQYQIAGKKGHFNIRAVNRRIPGLHFDLPYGQEGLFDDEGKPIQQRDPKRILFISAPYLHFTYLPRSSAASVDKLILDRSGKRKYELGIAFPNSFKYPEVLYKTLPLMMSSPWQESSRSFKIIAAFQTPLKKIKRRIFKK